MARNGRLPARSLVTIDGVQLSAVTALAWQRMKTAAALDGIGIWVALPIGGYRSYAVQVDMHRNPGRYGLNPASSVSIAPAGLSTHGLGTRVDVGSFPPARDLGRWGDAGRRRRNWLLANAHRFGFRREFDEADPNHFVHDGTIPASPKPPVIIRPEPTPEPEEADSMASPIVIIALRRESGPNYTAKCSVTAIPGGWEETTAQATADEFYSVAGVDEPHRVFSGNALKGGDEEAAAKYNRAKAGFRKAAQDYEQRQAEIAVATARAVKQAGL